MQLFYLFLISFFISSCTNHYQKKPKQNLFVSILPQKYFLERIIEDNYEIKVMVKPGFSPVTYKPSPQQMSDLSNSPLYFRIGVPFEKTWIDEIRSVNPDLKIIDTRQNIPFRKMDNIFDIINSDPQIQGNALESEDDHDHGLEDPHIWLSPSLVKIQAETIAFAMIELDPDNKDIYLRNLSIFQKELESLSDQIKKILIYLPSRYLMVFHPSWGYLTDEFDFKQIPIETMGKKPGIKAISEIIYFAKAKNIKTIFVQSQFSTREAEAIAEVLKARIVEIDPLAENYMGNMLNIANTIKNEL